MVVALGPGRFYGSSLPRPRFYSDVKLSSDGNRVDPPVGVLDPLLAWAHEAHWSMGGLSFDRHRLQGRIEGSLKLLRVQEERKEKAKKKRKMEERNIGVGLGAVTGGGGGRRKLRKTTARVVVPDVEVLQLPEDEVAPTESEAGEEASDDSSTPVAPPAPAARSTRSGAARRKQLRRVLLDDEKDDEGNVPETVESTPLAPSASAGVPSVAADERVSGSSPRLKKKRARKLGEEFDRVAAVDSPAPVPAASTPAAGSVGKRSEKKTPAKEKGKAADASSPRRNSPRTTPGKSSRRTRLLVV